MLIAFFSVFYASRRLERPGVSYEVRKMFQKKHLAYVIVFILIWTIQLVQNYYQLFNSFMTPGMQAPQGQPVFIVSSVMTFSTGIFLTAVRFIEPLFRYLMLSLVYQYYGLVLDALKEGQNEEQKLIEKDALSSFLSSSLNIELVYVLLQSITTFSKPKQSLEIKVLSRNEAAPKEKRIQTDVVTPIVLNTSKEHLKQQVSQQKDIYRELSLKQIIIKDIDRWNGAQTDKN